jgi:type II secretory pathway pseudopilin PulG
VLIFNTNSGKKAVISSALTGASLIEMAFFIVVCGILLTAGAPILRYYLNNRHLQTTESALIQAQNALDTYYQTYQRFPCPAPRNVALDMAAYGQEDTTNPCTTELTGVATNLGDGTVRTVNPLNQRLVRIGALPVRTLGLPDNGDVDGWTHRLLYAVTENYATTNAPLTMNAGAIIIRDSNGNSSTTCPGSGVYIVIAPGADPRGAYNTNGIILQPCDTNPGDIASMNCSDTGSFISTLHANYSGAGTFTSKAVYRAGTMCTQ